MKKISTYGFEIIAVIINLTVGAFVIGGMVL